MGGMGIFYLNKLSVKTKDILKDNYESLQYSQKMFQIIEDKQIIADSNTFEKQLKLQEVNITEIGEKELTEDVRSKFNRIKSDTSSLPDVQPFLKQSLFKISEINLQAIKRKDDEAGALAHEAIIFMTLVASVTIIVVLTFIINFPGYIANPVHELTESIKEITKGNYEHRLFFKSNDEFGELAIAFNEMAGKLDEYEHSNLANIIFQKKRIEVLINNMRDPIIGLDENSNILFANAEALNILGLNINDILNKYAPDVALHNDLLRNMIANDKSTKPLKIFDGVKEAYFIKDRIEITNEEKVIGQVFLLKNITDFKELDAAKTNFIATVSHELKTPLSSIQMCASLLEDIRVGELNAEQKEIVTTVKDETRRLMKITGELLDLAQVETGNIQLHPQPVNPNEIVNYAVQALKFQAEQKQIQLDLKIQENLPDLNVDLEKTAWVMVNILSNAIRYSPEKSSVIVEVLAEHKKVIFKVKDSGKGFDEKYKEKIFTKFYKIPDSGSSTVGTGLGLAISKEFITAQGGQIWVDTEIGKGSVFGFEFEV
jgi:signal transduction histidine kinase